MRARVEKVDALGWTKSTIGTRRESTLSVLVNFIFDRFIFPPLLLGPDKTEFFVL